MMLVSIIIIHKHDRHDEPGCETGIGRARDLLSRAFCIPASRGLDHRPDDRRHSSVALTGQLLHCGQSIQAGV